MSDKTYQDSNKDDSDTFVENEDNQSSNTGDLSSMVSERRNQSSNCNPTTEYQRIPVISSYQPGNKRKQETTDSMKGLPTGTKQQKGERYNTVLPSSSEAESLVSTPVCVSVIRHTRDVPPCISCPPESSNSTPEIHDAAAEEGAQADSSFNVCGDAQGVADPSCFACHMCNKCFFFKYELDRHSVVHNKEKNFSCQVCEEAFSLKGNLARHMLTHSEQKDFECDQCHRIFARKGNLLRHRRTHTGEKPHTCEKCGKRFSDPSYFKKHRKNCGSSSEAD